MPRIAPPPVGSVMAGACSELDWVGCAAVLPVRVDAGGVEPRAMPFITNLTPPRRTASYISDGELNTLRWLA